MVLTKKGKTAFRALIFGIEIATNAVIVYLSSMEKDEKKFAESVLNDLTHDVKTPLTTILGFTQLLLEDESISGSNREYLELIEAEAKRLNELVLDALHKFKQEIPTPLID